MKYLSKLIKENEEKLSTTDYKILNFVLENVEKVDTFSINTLADHCFVSHATILRLAKKLGFSGYSEFKSYIKFNKTTIDEARSGEISRSFLIEDLKKTSDLLKEQSVSQAVEAIEKADRVYLIGSWLLKSSAYFTAMRFNYYDSKFISPQNEEEVEIAFLNGISSNTLIIFLSFSGESKNIIKYAKKAQQVGATAISITSITKNSLSKLCALNFWAYYSVIYEPKNNECIASNLMIDYILEKIFLRYLHNHEILNTTTSIETSEVHDDML